MRNGSWTIAAALLLAGCAKPAGLAADHAWIRLAAVPGRPAAAYFTLHAGPVDATLVSVATPAAVRAEMHETMAAGMRRLSAVGVPADGALAFAPGGRHVMLFDVDPRLKPGGTTSLTLRFMDGRQLTTRAAIAGAGDPPPPS